MHAHAHFHIFTNAHTRAHKYGRPPARTHARPHARHTYMCTCIHACMCPSAEAEVQIRDAAAGVAKLAPVLAQQLFAADPASLKYLKASYADNGNSQNRANATFLDTTRV